MVSAHQNCVSAQYRKEGKENPVHTELTPMKVEESPHVRISLVFCWRSSLHEDTHIRTDRWVVGNQS